MQHHHSNQDNQESIQQNRETTEGRLEEALEFEHVEQLLQYDRGQVEPPSKIHDRLLETVSEESPTQKRWWQRLFS